VGLSIIGELWWWVTVIVLLREWGITLLRIWVIRYGVMAAGSGGKMKTLLQTFALGLFILPLKELDGAWNTVGEILWWIAVLVMLSTFGANNAVILTSARIYFSMARKGVAPGFLGRVHPTFHTPGAALAAQCLWAIVLIFSGTFDMLTDTLIFVGWIFYAAGAFGVFVLRRKMPAATRSYRVPGYPFVPAAFVVCAAVFLALTIYNDITGYRAALAAGKPAIINSAFGTVLVLIGTPIYFLCRTKKPPLPYPEPGLPSP
jgi:amino acid transporter